MSTSSSRWESLQGPFGDGPCEEDKIDASVWPARVVRADIDAFISTTIYLSRPTVAPHSKQATKGVNRRQDAMATPALCGQTADKWQQAFTRLNRNEPNISGLLSFSEVWLSV